MSTPKKVVIKPIIISNRKITFKKTMVTIINEDVIYESSNCDFLKGESQQVRIVNKVNKGNKTCRTIAKCTAKGVSVETTSDDICSLIGQKNYDTVLSALGSVFNEETKVRGILALLKKQTKYRTTSTQTDMDILSIKKECVDSSCQTLESNIEILGKQKQRKRIRRQQFTPYVVKEVKKCVINIDQAVKKEDVKKEIKEEQKEKVPELPDIKVYVDEDSNISCGSIGNISSISCSHLPDFLEEQKVKETLNSIQKQTCALNVRITVYDGTDIMVPVKPEDEFHIATPDILKNVLREERIKLLTHQALIDFKMCLEQNEDGYYCRIDLKFDTHIDVLHNDIDLIRRQCLALRARHESVDKLGGDMTALQMSIQHNSSVAATAELLRGGADPLLAGPERRSALHLAAAAAQPAHLRALLAHCDTHARQVLKNNQDFWKPELESMSDKDIAKYLYEKIGELFDDQGNTPLMAAAGSGRAEAVALLAGRAPPLVDAASPACGATALYRVVAAACLHAKETGNRTSVPEHFIKTAEVLVGHGADLTVENHSGSSVNSLLQEFHIPPLSMTLANKMSSMKHGNLDSSMILVKDKEGRIVHEKIQPRIARNNDSLIKFKTAVEFGTKRKLEKVTDVSIKGAKSLKVDTDINDANSCKIPDNITGLKSVPTQNSPNQAKASSCKIQSDKIAGVKSVLTQNSLQAKGSSCKIQSDKIAGLKSVPTQNSPQAKASGNRSKIVIVENVSVNTDFSKMNKVIVPSSPPVFSKPKDIVLVSTRKDPKFVKK